MTALLGFTGQEIHAAGGNGEQRYEMEISRAKDVYKTASRNRSRRGLKDAAAHGS